MMNYKINVKGVVNTYPANMLKLYVERQNVTSYRSVAIDAHCNVKSKITVILQFIGLRQMT